MWLIVLSYLLMASTFTIAKTAVFYVKPIFFIGFRMFIAGTCLLGYYYFSKREKLRIRSENKKLFALIIIFHIYLAYVLEFWALQFLTSSKVCLLYNLSPFITAGLCYLLYSQKLTRQQWVALIIGFGGMLPILASSSSKEVLLSHFGVFSTAELALILAIGASAYGWILMKQLITDRGYTVGLVNGVGMLGGGILALITALIWEGYHPFNWGRVPQDLVGMWLFPSLGDNGTTIAMGVGCMIALIVIANIIGYNLYGYLLKTYSPTFLSFAGFITPFFAVVFGWIFLFEVPSTPFFLSLGLTIASLYLFYRDEIIF